MTKAMAKSQPLYDVHPGVATVQRWVAELKEKTGRSLEEWLPLIKKEGPAQQQACREWLKAKHQLRTNSAWWLAERAAGKGGGETPEEYLRLAAQHVEEQYSGAKQKLRPVYDKLLGLGKSIAED